MIGRGLLRHAVSCERCSSDESERSETRIERATRCQRDPMTASGGEAGIDGLGTVSETKSKLEQMRRSPPEKPRDCRAVVKAERQVSGRRHAVSCERCSADEVLCQMVLVKNKGNLYRAVIKLLGILFLF